MRPLYRARQFWQGLTAAPLSAEARQLVERILSPAEQQGFDRLAPVDQWHSYQVLRLLQRHGHDEPALLKAALLHDIGKTRAPLSLLDRTVAVLGRLLIPGRAAAFGVPDEREGTDLIAIVAETEAEDPFKRQQIKKEIRQHVGRGSLITVAYVDLVPPRWLVKTSSGKVARGANREKWLAARSQRSSGTN